MHPNVVDIIGKQFGRLKVLRESKARNKRREVYWACLCSCGKEKNINGCDLRNGNTKSCGCLHYDMLCIKKGEANFNKLYDTYRRSAEKRGLGFYLDKDYFRKITKSECKYCGCIPSASFESKRSNGKYIYNGIDRIDNNCGYTRHNCVACCKKCNYMKHTSSLDGFLSHVRKIYEHSYR